jgi:putative ABC transport system substrate-binding protein
MQATTRSNIAQSGYTVVLDVTVRGLMRRRQFISVLGGAALWPLGARAQEQATPVIGWLSGISQQAAVAHHAQFVRGLGDYGFSPGRNVGLQYRWADGQYGRLPALAAELVGLPVDVIVAQTPPAALAAKAATAKIPIVFVVGIDPVAAGLVASYNRPGGNATGAAMIMGPLGQKRVEILRELAPKASAVAMLVNPHGPDAAPEVRDVVAAVQASGLQLRLINASTSSELDAAFAVLSAERPDAVLIGADPFLYVQRHNIVAQVARIGLVAVYPIREFVEAGGLISYGGSIASSFRQAGVYAGRILTGAKPADLPVVQPTTFELVMNLRTAKAQNIDIPPSLQARADEVID